MDLADMLIQSFEAALRTLSIVVWLGVMLSLTPAVWRLVRRRGRYLDPIWALSFLGIFDRLSFLLRVSPTFSHVLALIVAVTLAWLAKWYQNNDA